jgi:hypothetical protein
MNNTEERHLNENQVLMAVVDQDFLPAAMVGHLSGCSHCLSRKKDAEEKFYQLGQRARELAPAPRKRPHLPAAPLKNPLWRYLPASAFSFLLLSAIAWWGIFSHPPAQQSLSPARSLSMAGAWEDEGIMTDISTLSENALPEEYTRLTTADSADLDEDFFEYVVPSTDTPPLSGGWEIKGGRLC